MKIRITKDGARVRGIIQVSAGDEIDIPVEEAEQLIRNGEAVDPTVEVRPAPEAIEVREPEPENRDPSPKKQRRKKSDEL